MAKQKIQSYEETRNCCDEFMQLLATIDVENPKPNKGINWHVEDICWCSNCGTVKWIEICKDVRKSIVKKEQNPLRCATTYIMGKSKNAQWLMAANDQLAAILKKKDKEKAKLQKELYPHMADRKKLKNTKNMKK